MRRQYLHVCEGGSRPGIIKTGLSLHRRDSLAALWDGVGSSVLGQGILFPSSLHQASWLDPDHIRYLSSWY